MRYCVTFCLFSFVLMLAAAQANPYTDNDVLNEEDLSYPGAVNYLDELQQPAEKRNSCIRRSGNCDHRSQDCCYNSSCRCNLWGANCRCQRMGLFQKWG